MNSISDRVLRLRDDKKFSRKDLAELAEVSQPTIYNIENGKTDNITLSVGKKIAKALGISFGELFEIETNTVDLEHYQNELDKLWSALKEKNGEISDLKKQIEQKDLLINMLQKEREWYKESAFISIDNQYNSEINEIETLIKSAKNENEINNLNLKKQRAERQKEFILQNFIRINFFTKEDIENYYQKLKEHHEALAAIGQKK